MQVWACSGGFVFAGIRVYSLPQMAGEAVRAALMFCFEESVLCARRRNPQPPVGLDAPTPARIGTGRPKGRSHFSFGGERKVCKRKPAARRLREKALYCPFLKEGVRNVARRPVSEITHTFVRARAHSFPLSKRARLFPSAAYRRSAPPQLTRDILK